MSFVELQQLARRLARMERAELRFRARQEFAKRQDALLSFLHFDFAMHRRRSGNAVPGNFFFGREEVSSLLELLRQQMPDQVNHIVDRADRILQHRFDLLGYSELDYGSPIDWHLDLIHGKRAPRKPFYRVRYLDFEEVGDSKITWELNRHQHFPVLAKAFRLTGNNRYPDEILRQWRHWWTENPYPIGINWASSLEAAFRSLSWLWTYHLLLGAPGIPDFREEWLRGLALHGRHIERYLSTYFSPNTHFLGEGVALFSLGVLCPELADAQRWKATGWRIVLEESQRQVRADGLHFEQSIYYHVYALDFFLHAAILASMNGVPLPSEFEATLEKMLSALCLLGRAGEPPRFGDDDGGRLFDPRRNRSEHLLDPLAAGAVLFHRGDFKSVAGNLREETIWLLGTQGVRLWDELEAIPPDMSSLSLSTSGFYLLTSASPASQLVVDCGPLGTQSGGHGHADGLSLTLQSKGHSLLIDPGACEYTGDGEDRNLFRGTAMHNTLRVDGVDQAEPATAFSWRRLTEAKAEHWVVGKDFDLLVGSHDGYQRLEQPVTHRRWVFSLRNGMYLVRDRVEGQGEHRLELFWQLGPDLQLIEERLFRVKGASHGLALLPVEKHGWAEESRRQAWSPVYGQRASTSVAVFFNTGEIPSEFCVLLVAMEEALRRPGRFVQIEDKDGDSGVHGYGFSGAEECQFYFCDSGEPWRYNGVASDAQFVCTRRGLNGEQGLILVNGSQAEMKDVGVRFKRRIQWGKITVEGNRREVFTSESDALSEEPALTVQGGPIPATIQE